MADLQITKHLINLHCSDPSASIHAAEALGDLRDASAVPALLKELEISKFREFTNLQFRCRVAQALGEIGDPAAVPGLLKALGDKNEDVRRCAAYALGKIGDASAIPALIKVSKKDREVVRIAAAKALGMLGDSSAVLALIEIMQTRIDPIGIEAAEALGIIGDASAVPALIRTLQNPRWIPAERMRILAVLGRIGHTDAIPVLFEALKDRDIGRSAILALTNIVNEATIPALISALVHGDPIIRRTAAEALGKIGDTVALQALSKALQDPSPSVRWDAAFALRLQEDQLAIAVFLEVFKDREQRKEVFYANKQRVEQLHFTLWKIGSPVIPALLDALKDNDEAMQQASGRILRAIGSSDKLARKILAENSFTPKERILVLDSLRQALASHFETDQGRRFPKTDVLCRQVLEEEDSAARAGAEAVLNAISLLRGSQADTDHYSEELVRPAEPGAFRAEPQSMLRAADQPQESREPLAPRRTIWQRLFEK